MSLLFSPLKIGPMIIKNRFMRSPTYESLANPDGTPKPRLLRMVEKLAEGDVGLIVPGYVYPMEGAKAAPRQSALYNQKHADSWKSTIDKVHKFGSKIIFQICHGGVDVISGLEKKTPSPLPGKSEALTISEIEDIINSFYKSSMLAKSCGADGIQFHSAHGYLLSTFLSPLFNRREDKYGGTIEGRSRIISEMSEAIRKGAGPDFSISIKLNGNDFLPFGTTPEIASEYVHHLKSKIDMFEISCGICNHTCTIRPKNVGFINRFIYGFKFEEGYNLKLAEYIKRKNPDTVIASVGGFKTVKFMEETMVKNKADIISLCRPFIREPDLVKKIFEKKVTQSECKHCNHCLFHLEENDHGVICDYP